MRPLVILANIFRFNRKNWRAFVLCIFAATIFWFFNALNKQYTTNLNYPLTFDYDRENFVPVNELPEFVRVNVTGNGWDLFKRSSGVKAKPIEIPLERPSDIKKIVGSTLPVFFSNQSEDLEVNFVITDTLFIDLEPKMGQWLQVKLDSVSNYIKEGFGRGSAVSVIPDSIYVEGPARLIRNLPVPYPLHLRRRNIDEQFMEDVEVELPSPELIRRDPANVAVMFNVARLVEVSDSVRLTAINLPKTVAEVEEKLIPVTFLVPENLVGEISFDSARAVIDLSNFSTGSTRVMPSVTGVPSLARVSKVDSVFITL